jgi:hypothetical protein
MEKWFIALNYCREKGIPPEWVTHPKQFRGYQQSAARITVVKELAKRGISTSEIQILCPLTKRAIKWMKRDLGLKEAVEHSLNGKDSLT